ncbi:patatin-like phospholipase family protein [Chloroflexi bacterium TSY]|nr:patatin-like phospholipase family protein [Chloroflexi bacterium TSY]
MSQKISHPRIGWALGGGGMRGLAHIGVLKVLNEENLPIDIIAGTSMGGLIGGAYACGAKVERIEEEAERLSHLSNFVRLIDPWPGGLNSMLSGDRILAYLDQFLGRHIHFSDLDISFAVTAVDLETGREVILQQGSVIEAMRATMSVPGVFKPVEMNSCHLIDGGVLNNVPVDVAFQLGADVVFAVDVMPSFAVNSPGEPPQEKPFDFPAILPMAQVAWHTALFMMSRITESSLQKTPPHLLIRPQIPEGVSLFTGMDKYKDLVTAGADATRNMVPRIRQIIETGSID